MKFAFYSLFGWGTPLILAILTALFDVFPNWGNVRPQMGDSVCFLSIHGARFFFYMPILILLCFNTVMYLVTVYSLWNTKKGSKKAAINRIKSQRGQQRDLLRSANPGSTIINVSFNNEFIRCFHQFASPILSTNVSQFEQLKKKTNFLLVQNNFFC
jgi:hypothetical protein